MLQGGAGHIEGVAWQILGRCSELCAVNGRRLPPPRSVGETPHPPPIGALALLTSPRDWPYACDCSLPTHGYSLSHLRVQALVTGRKKDEKHVLTRLKLARAKAQRAAKAARRATRDSASRTCASVRARQESRHKSRRDSGRDSGRASSDDEGDLGDLASSTRRGTAAWVGSLALGAPSRPPPPPPPVPRDDRAPGEAKKSFRAMGRKVVLATRAANSMAIPTEEEERAAAAAVFLRLDADGSGALEWLEVHAALHKL